MKLTASYSVWPTRSPQGSITESCIDGNFERYIVQCWDVHPRSYQTFYMQHIFRSNGLTYHHLQFIFGHVGCNVRYVQIYWIVHNIGSQVVFMHQTWSNRSRMCRLSHNMSQETTISSGRISALHALQLSITSPTVIDEKYTYWWRRVAIGNNNCVGCK